ncbi:hypothetical protein [Desulfovibrio sp. ZJ200]|uniref:hypothetical protein n=1 Tax=Desulfovibrio sp. ZJ200 TaxID=2709792 RepID=UPI0013E9BA13|nr:hypothetical protein [Desulfovibrio sp. ZJ200]
MDTKACFINDRALSLAYEAVRFPATAESALAWLRRAMAVATANGNSQLFSALRRHYVFIRANGGQGQRTV